MLLAYDYPLLGILFSTLWFMVWVMWLMVLFHVLADIFRSDIKGIAKASWAMLVVFLPLVGVFAYCIVHGDDMGARAQERRTARTSPVTYDQARDRSGNVADQIAQLGHLREEGELTDRDYEAAKAKILR